MSCFLGSELQVESQADVARMGAMIGNSKIRGLMGSEWQQWGQRPATQGGRFEGAGGPGGGTLWPELQAEYQADVDREGATAESGTNRRSMDGGQLQGGVVCGDSIRGAGTEGCFLGAELRAGLRRMWLGRRGRPMGWRMSLAVNGSGVFETSGRLCSSGSLRPIGQQAASGGQSS